MMKFSKTLVAAAFAACALSANAGSFVNLPDTSPLRVSGSQNLNVDPLHIPEGAVTGTDIDGFNTYAAPAAFELLAEMTTVVELDGEEVGDFFDYVFRDTSDNLLVFGSRVVLTSEDAEINDIFRGGFTGASAAAAWSFASDLDLRLYSAARTATGIKQGADVFDADVVNMRSDINVQEGNASTGYFFIKTDAMYYTLMDGVVRVRQGGEEGQPDVSFSFAGFAPTNTAPIPEPSTYALLLGGLGLIGFAVRRRRT